MQKYKVKKMKKINRHYVVMISDYNTEQDGEFAVCSVLVTLITGEKIKVKSTRFVDGRATQKDFMDAKLDLMRDLKKIICNPEDL